MDTLKAILPCKDCGPSDYYSTQCPGGTFENANGVSHDHKGARVIELHAVPTEHGIVYTAVEWGVQE